MEERIKKEFILEGLNCNKCLIDIENETNKLDNVKAKVDCNNKIIELEFEKENMIDLILIKISSIINNHRHQIVIKEKSINKLIKKNMVVAKLGCANCAVKIEKGIKNIEGVKDASIDFVTKKLKIETENSHELNRIIKEAQAIVKKIEPDALLIEEETNKKEEKEHVHKHDHNIEHNSIKNEIFILLSSGILLTIGLFFDFPLWAELIIYLLSYLIVGFKILINAFKTIIKGQIFDENFLMSIATIGAFFIKQFPEGVAVMLFFRIGELFQEIAVNKSRKSITALMDIRPVFANLKENDSIKKVNPEEIEVNDIIIVKAGEKIPLDGIVISGNSFLDTSALTGESLPKDVNEGDEVLGGFINTNKLLEIRVTKKYNDSTVAKIIDLVENASKNKAKTENFITTFAKYYTPFVVISALLLALLTPIVTNASLSVSIYRALIFLVISCPCALVISIPLGFFGGIGSSSRNGILIKGSNYLDALNNIETVVFDKTGTLTKGIFEVTEIVAVNNFDKKTLLKYAAYAESYSNHPIALSIIKTYNSNIDKNIIKSYEEISGHGVKVVIDNNEVLVGNNKLMEKENIIFNKKDYLVTTIHIAINKEYAGYILISDVIKDDAKSFINQLKELGIKRTVMLTGDVNSIAQKVKDELNINEVYAELLPEDKVHKIEEINKATKANKKVIFIGDGINDAPVLARSDIGVAMGAIGSDAAIEAADIVIMNDELSKLITGIKIAKKTRKIVWQNIIFALSIKGIFLILGAIGIATMWEAVFADVGVSLLAVLNAIRVLNYKNKKVLL